MANTIKIKRSVPPSETAPAALARGELAYNENTQLLFIGAGDETDGVAANHITIADEVTSARPCDGTGTQVSTDVSLAGTPDYISLSTQTLTLGQIDLATDVTGDLPDAEIASADTWNAAHQPGDALAMGDTKVTGLKTPTDDTDATTKAYVDAKAQGLDVKASVKVATTVELPESTYTQLVSTTGVGAIIEANSNGFLDEVSANKIDTVTVVVGDRVLVRHASAGDNGIYTVTTLGAANAKWKLTRATDFDETDEISSAAFVFVEQGTVNANTGWVVSTDGTIQFTGGAFSGVSWVQFSGAGTFTATDGLDLVASAFGIADKGVTLAKMDDVTANTVIGRLTDGGVPTLLSAGNVLSLIGVVTGAQVNVKSDWTEATATDDAFIQNKPALGGAALLDVGTADDEVCAGDDDRLSDSRAPTTHSHGVAHGGTGLNTLVDGAVMLGNGTNAITMLGKVAAGQLLTSGGTGGGDEAAWSDSLSGITINCGTF